MGNSTKTLSSYFSFGSMAKNRKEVISTSSCQYIFYYSLQTNTLLMANGEQEWLQNLSWERKKFALVYKFFPSTF